MTTRFTLPLLAAGLCLLAGSGALQAQTAGDFGRRPAVPLAPPFSDPEIAELMTQLEQRLDAAVATEHAAPGPILDGFIRKLQTGRLTAAQEDRVAAPEAMLRQRERRQ